jgi:transcriptional antiterminator RfaH
MLSDLETEFSWFCLKSQPRHEHIAAAHLRKMSEVDVFAPRIRFQRPTLQGARWIEEAMFPGYLFARFKFAERHKEICYAPGISTILRFGDQYARLDDTIITGIREQTNAAQVVIVGSEVSEGTRVAVVEGALRGLEAVVTQVLSGRERIRVLVNFFGREISAEVNRPALLPARKHPLAA